MPRQPFHLVEYSPWPFLSSICALSLTVGLTCWFHLKTTTCLFLALLMMGLIMLQWWRDVIREATYMGYHTNQVTAGLRWGMVLFISSEMLFFFAFFWAFFHSSLAPTPELGCTWPPTSVIPINPFSIPLLNTAVLLASGVTVTWAHHAILEKHHTSVTRALTLTVLLGMYFTLLQLHEYKEAPFSIADSVYGSSFFVATGFHGLHVLIGSTFLMICLSRNLLQQFSKTHHFGFEAAAWYWHFVDVVWICLFICLYWWGS